MKVPLLAMDSPLPDFGPDVEQGWLAVVWCCAVACVSSNECWLAVPLDMNDRVGVAIRHLTKEFPGSDNSTFKAVDDVRCCCVCLVSECCRCS